MNSELLEKTGLQHLDPTQFQAEAVILRDGREAVIWVDSQSGHGILDPAYWVAENYYRGKYRNHSSAKADGTRVSPRNHLTIFKNLNAKQFLQFDHLLKPESRVLEVGCSFGGVLRNIANAGVAACHAVEPNQEDAEFARKLVPEAEIFPKSFEDADLQKEFYDLIIGFEVLEHIPSPSTFLMKVSSLLKYGGVVNFEVPNHRAALLKFYKETTYDRFYYHQAHIHYFTDQSLNQLFQFCGFEGEVTSFSMYPFFNHVYWHLNRGPQASAKLALNTPHPAPKNCEVGRKINDFYCQVENQYEALLNRHGVGDCLVFQGRKNRLG